MDRVTLSLRASIARTAQMMDLLRTAAKTPEDFSYYSKAMDALDSLQLATYETSTSEKK